MKNENNNSKSSIIKNILKAIGYFMIYFLVSEAVSFIYMFIYIFAYLSKLGYDKVLTIVENSQEFTMLLQEMLEKLLAQTTIISIISSVVVLLVLFIIFKARKKNIKEELLINKIDKRAILPIILMGLALNIFTEILISIIPFSEELLMQYSQNVALAFSGNTLIDIIAVAIIAPIIEEIVFRGLVFTRLNKGINTVVAVILSSLLFAIMHMQLIWIIYAFIFGIIFNLIYIRFKSLLANILLHMSYNSVPFILMAIMGENAENISINYVLAALSAIVIGTMTYVILKITKNRTEQKEEAITE